MQLSVYMMKHLYFKQFEGCFFKSKPTIILTIITYEDFSFGIFPKFFGFLLLKFEWCICFKRNFYFKSCNESYLLLQTWIWAHLKHIFLSAFGANSNCRPKRITLPWLFNYFTPPPAVWEQFIGHVPWCTKIHMQKNFIGRVELRRGVK